MLLDVSPTAGPGGALASERGTRDRSGKSSTATGSGGPAITDEQAELPYRGGADELDLDATVARIAGRPAVDEDDIVVRERIAATRSVVLLVDVSGSMRGERVRTAAATVGALAAELSRDNLAVVAFTRGYCCCQTACTTPAPTPARSRPGCPGSTCCSTRPASRTAGWAASSRASAAGSSGWPAPTAMSHPLSARSSQS